MISPAFENGPVKVALVTGGGSGIGRACSLLLSESYEIWLTYSSHPEQAQAVVKEIKGNGGKAHALKLDLGQPTSVKDACQAFAEYYQAAGQLPRLDLLVSNAGTFGNGYHFLVDIEETEWDQVWEINVGGISRLFRRLAPWLSPDGVVLNISSMVARLGAIGYKSQVHYALTKAVTNGLFASLQATPEARRWRFVNILPGLIETGMLRDHLGNDYATYTQAVPLGQLGTPGDVANLVVFLASEAGSYISGTNILIDGGWTQKGWQHPKALKKFEE